MWIRSDAYRFYIRSAVKACPALRPSRVAISSNTKRLVRQRSLPLSSSAQKMKIGGIYSFDRKHLSRFKHVQQREPDV